MTSTRIARRLINAFAASVFAACALVLALALGAAPAFATTIPDLTSDAECQPRNGVPMPVVVTLDQPTTREIAMRTISEYRQEAYDKGLVDLPAGMSVGQYVHGFTWNADLERIAVQRAIEGCVAEGLGHDRPNGVWMGKTYSNGVSNIVESLASWGVYKGSSYNLEYIEMIRSHSDFSFGLNMWHSEIVSCESNKTKGTNYSYGHYWSMVNPSYTSFGGASVAVAGAEWTTCALEAGKGDLTPASESLGYVGVYDATVYANDNKCFTMDIHPYCQSGSVKVGESSQMKMTASSSFSGTKSWAVEPSYASYQSMNPLVLRVDQDGTVTGISEGVAEVVVTIGDKTASVYVPVTDKQAAFRLYNPNSGEHFYTLDSDENAHLAEVGWYPEGLGWVSASDKSIPVYRLYNQNGGEHHYTTDAAERDTLVAVGWNYEGVGWYSDPAKGKVLYREYNPNMFSCNHNYTTDKEEHDYLVSLGWRDEGTAWFGVDVWTESSRDLVAG